MPHRHGRPLIAVLAALMLMTMGAATATAAIPQPAGGPILVVTSGSDPFGSYYTEILRNEGFNDFATADVSSLSASALNSHDTVILAAPGVTDAQVSLLTNWVQSGGNLIAMRPDPKLAPLLGLSAPSGILSEGNLRLDTGSAPGAGITSSVLQYHGAADLYALAGARAVATLYSGVSTPTSSPAVSLRDVGTGHAAAFTFDLARSVVATRQGNIAWVGQNRDRDFADPITFNPDPVVRSNDLFFGGNEPDWVDLSRVAIPQADEQQRLLANLITQFSYTPAPHFWYFPKGDKAVLAMTGDDHGSGGTNNVFDTLLSLGPDGCRPPIDHTLVDGWGCPRATSYVYPDNTIIEPEVAANWNTYGFEIAAHPLFGSDGSCLDFTSTNELRGWIGGELAEFKKKFPAVPAPATTRTHCLTWSDWDSQPKVDAENGIRLNTDYYWFPAAWTLNRAGLFTGSGMPMRFAAADGSLIDVYQATTYGADDAVRVNSADTADPNAVIPAMGKTLIDNALGTDGYYGAFTIQVHSDEPGDAPGRNALIADAMNRHVPIVSERQLLTWLDGRDTSKFTDVSFGADGKLRFTVVPGAGARGLQAMLPVQGSSGALSRLTRDGDSVIYGSQTIKGVEYAILPDASGDYVATYPAPSRSHPHVETGGANNGGGGSSTTGGGSTGAVKGASSNPTKAASFATASAKRFRPGSRRTFVLTVRLRKDSRLVVTFRGKDGKVVRTIKVPKRKAGTTVRVRWDGKDRHGHYVSAGTYRYALTAIGNRYLKTAGGSVAVLRAG
jgi:flagellar hook capping protein FlgD